MENLYGWWFTFSPFTGKWAAMEMETIPKYTNDFHAKNVIRSSRIETLQEMIISTKGSFSEMEKKYKI